MKQQPKTIPAGHFKAHCLALLDKVARTRQPLIVTKRGKPVAKVVPTELGAPGDLLGREISRRHSRSDGRMGSRAMIVLDTHTWLWWVSDLLVSAVLHTAG